MKLATRILALLLATAAIAPAQGTKLAATPPMGWNSWNFFAGRVTDKDIRDTADLLVSTGMRDAGYVYVNIDDTWEGKRDAQGRITTNEKFPDMKALVRLRPLKGPQARHLLLTRPPNLRPLRGKSYQHEQQDARTFTHRLGDRLPEV